MALIETRDLTGPLKQGDILRDLELYFSALNGSVAPVDGEVSWFGLVLSRNCKTVRAEFILVSAIKAYTSDNFKQVTSDTPDGKRPSLDLMRRRFDDIRDGGGQPDQFYLGTLPEQGGKRFAARLDSIHTVQLPTTPEEREIWLSSKRIARLSDDHRRHLQARFFDAIAHEGFDDFRWWCDRDLELLITASQQHLHESDAQITKIRADIQILEGSAASKQEEKRLEGLRTQLQNTEQDRSKKANELDPYQREMRRRKQEAPKPTEE